MTLPLLYISPSAQRIIERNVRNARAAEIRTALRKPIEPITWDMDKPRQQRKTPAPYVRTYRAVENDAGQRFPSSGLAAKAMRGADGRAASIRSAIRKHESVYGYCWFYVGSREAAKLCVA